MFIERSMTPTLHHLIAGADAPTILSYSEIAIPLDKP